MKNKNQLAYYENIIKNDRYNLREDFTELFIKDLGVLLNEYYDIVEGTSINVSKNGGVYFVNINFTAKAPRYFNKLPNI